MARIGGRSTWFAWLVGVVCVGVVGFVVYLAAPMFPAVFDWSGQALRGELDRPVATNGAVAPVQAEDPAGVSVPGTCRDLYQDDLWGLLSTAGGVELLETTDASPTRVGDLAQTVGATVQLSCSWRADSGVQVTTTIAETSADGAPDAAGRALSAAGFVCSPSGLGVRCENASGEGADRVAEAHVVRDGMWLSTVEQGWEPPGYVTAVESALWPE